MNKTEAAQILNIDVNDSAELIEARYLQVSAFFCDDPEATASLKELTEKAKAQFANAYQAFPGLKKPQNKEGNQKPEPDIEQQTSKQSTLRSFIFPHPIESAGAAFSDQWWRVYKRAVILALLTTALALDQAPRFLHQLQKKDAGSSYIPPYVAPTQSPSPSNANPPFGGVAPPPDSSNSSSLAPVSNSLTLSNPFTLTTPNPVIDPSLNPTPNPNPLVIAPTQTPQSFLVGLFWAIKQGNSTESMIKQPPTASVSRMLFRSYAVCPTLDQLPPDAMQILSQSAGSATVRVNERHFTGFQEKNDYYLESVNGVWKLTDIVPAPAQSGVMP